MTITQTIEELQAIKSVYSNKDKFGDKRLINSEEKALDVAIESIELLRNMIKELSKFEDHACWAVGDIKKMLGVENGGEQIKERGIEKWIK